MPPARGEPVAHVRHRAAHHLFVQLRELAAHGHLALRERGRQRLERIDQPVGALVEHERGVKGAQRFKESLTLGLLAWEEAAKIEARVHAAAGHVSRRGRRRAGQHLHGRLRLARSAHQPQARVGHAWHAGVRTVDHGFARQHAFDDARGPVGQRRLVQPFEPLLYAERGQKPAGHTRVLGAYHVGGAQGVQGARGHVAQIAQRRRAYDQSALFPVRHRSHLSNPVPAPPRRRTINCFADRSPIQPAHGGSRLCACRGRRHS